MYDLEIPISGVRMKFVDRAYAVRATSRRHAIDISTPIYRDSRTRPGAVVSAGEGMDNTLGPSAIGLSQFVGNSAPTFTTT